MPKSKPRQKPRPRRASERYRLEPDRRRRPKPSPRWYGPAILAIMGLGVVMIVTNYMQLLPGTSGAAPLPEGGRVPDARTRVPRPLF